jgi:signal transduction histidine kinase
MATVGQISTQVAHDLRNPLTALNTDLYVLEETLPKPRGKKLKETLGSMQASVTHSNKIVTDLLEFSGGGEVKSVSLLLDGVIRDSLATVHVPRGIKVEIGGSSEAHMSGDPTRLMRMFSNVLRNSIEAMPSGGRVIISMKVLRRRAQVFIRDEGVGMRREELSKLFTPYFTTKASGLGLGLAIAKQIAEAHGGRIDVRSRIGEGTTVRITLPLARRPGRRHTEEPSRASPSSPLSSTE